MAQIYALQECYRRAEESKRPAIERQLDTLLGCGTPSTDALQHLPKRLDVPKAAGVGNADLIPGAALEAALENGRTALAETDTDLVQGYADPQAGGRPHLMKAWIAKRDPTCQGDALVGGWGNAGLSEIAKRTPSAARTEVRTRAERHAAETKCDYRDAVRVVLKADPELAAAYAQPATPADRSSYSLETAKKKVQAPSSSAGFIHAVTAFGRFITPSSVSDVRSVFWATCPLSRDCWIDTMRIETKTSRWGMAPGWFGQQPPKSPPWDVTPGSGSLANAQPTEAQVRTEQQESGAAQMWDLSGPRSDDSD